MADFSKDTDLVKYQFDIMKFGVDSWTQFHADAKSDILVDLRLDWFPKTGYRGDLDPDLLTDSQWLRASVYRVLGWYAYGQLSNEEGDKFDRLMKAYQSRYGVEFNSIVSDGVEYDFDEDGTVDDSEKAGFDNRRSR